MKRIILAILLLGVSSATWVGCSSFSGEANVTRDQWEPPVSESQSAE